jgi:hypothetical protein
VAAAAGERRVKLPDIEYSTPVQRSSGDLPRLDEAQRRAAAVVAEGLTRYGMELVKTETQAASADLAAGLADLEVQLTSRRYVSTKDLRDALGADFDSLPPELKARTRTQAFDINAGAMVDVDRDDIPVWEVAGAIYDARAKRLLDTASRRIASSGWRSEFQAQAQDEVFARKVKLAQHQMQAMNADLRARQASVIETFTRAGDFGKASAAIASSDLFTPAEKEELEGKVEHARQLQPLEDRLLLGVSSPKDVRSARQLIRALEGGSVAVPPPVPRGGTPHDLTKPILRNADGSWSTEETATFEVDGKHVVIATIVNGVRHSPKEAFRLYREGKNDAVGTFDTAQAADEYAQTRHEEEELLRGAEARGLSLSFDRLDDKERIDWKRRLEAEVKAFEHEAKDAAANRFREADEAAKNALLGAYIQAGGRPLPMKLVPAPGTVSSGTLQWAIQLVESTRPGKKPVETDLTVYAELTQLAMKDPAKFKEADLTPYLGRLSIPHATHFLDLQRTLKATGPEDPKYTSFVGGQEETNRRLVGHGFHVTGKDAEDDAVAVGHVHAAVNRALWKATVAKARAGKGAELDLDERDAIIGRVVDQEVAAKGWKASAPSSGIEPAYQGPVRDAAAALGKPQDPKTLKDLRVELGAWEGDIVSAWRSSAGDRALTPAEAAGVFTVLQRHRAEIDQALTNQGKPLTSTNRALLAARAYLRGTR